MIPQVNLEQKLKAVETFLSLATDYGCVESVASVLTDALSFYITHEPLLTEKVPSKDEAEKIHFAFSMMMRSLRELHKLQQVCYPPKI